MMDRAKRRAASEDDNHWMEGPRSNVDRGFRCRAFVWGITREKMVFRNNTGGRMAVDEWDRWASDEYR